ncbi:MAG: cell division protein ZapA [Boseongicola sp. SB0662_bin_57]|nr:cell division protein ZapA [Boseongicola sp. SB0662_bin_57]
MPEVSIRIGERLFKVSCQDGEEAALHQAAGLLNTEAKTLEGQSRRLPEAQMLLMAGLMLADKHVAAAGNNRQLEETVARQEARIKDLESQVEQGRMRAAPSKDKVSEALARIAERAEALAESAEKMSGARA